MRSEDFTTNLTTLLIETFESPPAPTSAYLDQRSGLFETLVGVPAESASITISEGGTSIAAQVEHTRFFLDALLQFMDGGTDRVDWRESWRVDAVESWGDDEVGDAMAILVHTTYHLGAIRQIARAVTTAAPAAVADAGDGDAA